MTLLVAVGNLEYVAVVSDRRLTGRAEDESNKTVILHSPGIRAVAAYTGLAEAGAFKTAVWLPEALHAAMTTGALDLEAFCASATGTFSRLHLARAQDLCLSIGIFGFFVASDESVGRLTRIFISNCRDRTNPARFSSIVEEASEPRNSLASFAVIGGAHRPAYQSRRQALEDLARQNRPANAVVAKAIELIHEAARSDPTVGKQCSSVVVTREGSGRFNYHSGTLTTRIYTPAIVTPTDAFLGAYIERISPGVAAVPKVRSVEPCPCRSGRRYGRCHGRPPTRGVQPKIVFTPEGRVQMHVGPHQLSSDRDSLVFDLRDVDLLPTRRQSRKRVGGQ